MNEQDTEEVISHRGWPCIKIYDNQLVCLLECGFKNSRYYCHDFFLFKKNHWEADARFKYYYVELDEKSRISIHPQCGVKTVLGQLRSQGYKVQSKTLLTTNSSQWSACAQKKYTMWKDLIACGIWMGTIS